MRPGRDSGRLQGFSRLGFALQRIPGCGQVRPGRARPASGGQRIDSGSAGAGCGQARRAPRSGESRNAATPQRRSWGECCQGAPSGQGVRSMSGLPGFETVIPRSAGVQTSVLNEACRSPGGGEARRGKPDVPPKPSGADGTRTRGLRAASATLSQLSYGPTANASVASNSNSDAQLIGAVGCGRSRC